MYQQKKKYFFFSFWQFQILHLLLIVNCQIDMVLFPSITFLPPSHSRLYAARTIESTIHVTTTFQDGLARWTGGVPPAERVPRV